MEFIRSYEPEISTTNPKNFVRKPTPRRQNAQLDAINRVPSHRGESPMMLRVRDRRSRRCYYDSPLLAPYPSGEIFSSFENPNRQADDRLEETSGLETARRGLDHLRFTIGRGSSSK
ncbi:uncharacterized protein LOC143151548 [Ptiloglossa arizonensis]|uniref:uncharacterized protein LOC143151548 n=1 Tax=Ptiloglossa arizonensis TaxID=3350558 RepID=UPI003FA10582